MTIKLRTSWSIPIYLGVFTLFFVLRAIIKVETILNPFLIALFVLFLISLVRFLGTTLSISDEYIEYQYWMLKREKIHTKDIEDVKLLKGRVRQYLEIMTADRVYKIKPYFSITLLSVMGWVTGQPYHLEEAQIQLKKELSTKRKIDFIFVSTLVMVFLGVFFFRVSVMNQPKINVISFTAQSLEFPSEDTLAEFYTLYMSDIRIWDEEDAASESLSALKSELGFVSRLLDNTYFVYFNVADRFYTVFKFGSSDELSFVLYMYKGESEVYFRAY